MTVDSPAPHLPRGAGGPCARAAGRGLPAVALVLEPDQLARLLVGPAVEALGFSPTFDGTAAPNLAAVFVPLERGTDCRDVRRDLAGHGRRRHTGEVACEAPAAPVLVGYGEGPPSLLAAHRAHGCCDLVLRLVASSGAPRLRQLPPADAVGAAGLSVREADVLVLLLRGLTTPAIAARLRVAECTARTHCRAVLRKVGVPDRRELRTVLDAPGPQVCRGRDASFGEESDLAVPRSALHT